jgi:anti-sigma B factor antagonist
MTMPFSQQHPPPGLQKRMRQDQPAAAQPPGPPCAAEPVVVTLPGEIDAVNAGQVYGVLIRALETGTGMVVADATATAFCDCAGVRALARAHYRAAASGIDLRVAAAASRKVRRILELTGTGQLLHTYPTLPAALNGPPRTPGAPSLAAGTSAGAASCEHPAADSGRGMT